MCHGLFHLMFIVFCGEIIINHRVFTDLLFLKLTGQQ
jgi:hypothetical protein